MQTQARPQVVPKAPPRPDLPAMGSGLFGRETDVERGSGSGRSHPVRPRRHRRRRWPWAAAMAAVLVACGAAGASLVFGRDLPPAPQPEPEPTAASAAFTGSSRLTALIVRGSDPLVAVVGSMGEPRPVVALVPGELLLTVPGHGTYTVDDASVGPGSLLSLALSNAMGTWIDDHAVTDLQALVEAVDASGGIELRLTSAVAVDGGVIGPGVARMSGEQVAAYVEGGPVVARRERWADVLRGLLGSPAAVWERAVVEAEHRAGVAAALSAAADVQVTELPTTPGSGGLLLPDDARIRRLVSEAFGIEAEPPVAVVVLNGSGAPGVGEAVARRLIPGGFRVVATGNARSFDHEITDVMAGTRVVLEDAERASDLLGVGAVGYVRGSSSLADVTIVVGRDFPSG